MQKFKSYFLEENEIDVESKLDDPTVVNVRTHNRSHPTPYAAPLVNIQICDLSVVYTPSQPIWTTVGALCGKHTGKEKGRPPKAILSRVSASIPPGTLTAIIGSSGSGKTTLLNTMASRVISKNLKITGDIMCNGDTDFGRVRSAYVVQQDLLLPSLTVRETLHYAADLRLAGHYSRSERASVVEDTILQLGLKGCADTRIGSHLHKSCSGGEKRRTSMGVQMLGNPSVLFCDEPTTGLDAHSAFQVVEALKQMAQRGRTIVISIHAPRSEMWTLFDRVVLLTGGHVLYSGEPSGAIDHFRSCGYQMPAFTNPAEFLISLAARDTRTEEADASSHVRIELLKERWSEKEKFIGSPSGAAIPLKQALNGQESCSAMQSAGHLRQIEVLTRRTIKITARDMSGLVGGWLEAVVMGTLTGWIFHHPGNDLTSIRTLQGALYTAIGLQQYIWLLIEIFRLTSDMRIFDRERADKTVGVIPFLLSRRAAKIFLEDIPVPLIYGTIYYFMVGFRFDVPTYLIFIALSIIGQYTSMMLATVCVAISRDFTAASLVANLVCTMQSFSCGYFVQANQISFWLRWIKWAAYLYYSLGALVYNEFIGVRGGPLGQVFACPNPDVLSAECAQYTGRFIVASMGFPDDWLWQPTLVAACFPIFFFVVAALILSFWKVEIGVIGGKNQDSDDRLQAGYTRPRQALRKITIGLNQYSLDLRTWSVWKHTIDKTILDHVTTTFEPGKLNVIMGPSGSGKTTLLQSLAVRLHGNTFASWLSSGYITVNGAAAAPEVLRSITSFVTQDDDALMPYLTVRETLQYAAGLRLPRWMSLQEKHRRAEDVLLKMGLKDCADRFIGSDLKKGISGGEKRRVSIAIQILTDPQVLVLDEPTSGLDTFLAKSVFEVLRTLADEGRTIIVTVHQAPSELFKTFDNILLLARAGAVVYSGPGDGMLSHFASRHGLFSPREVNPADFALDLITVDLQHEHREAVSRKRVRRLVKDWAWIQQQHSSKPVTAVVNTPAELSSFKRETNSFFVMFSLVLRRSALNIRRDPGIIAARTTQVLGLGLVMCLWYTPLQSNFESIQSRMGLIQEVTAIYYVGMLQNLAVYPTERNLFKREHADAACTPTAFLLSYTALELPSTAISCVIFALLTVLAPGLSSSPATVFAAALNTFAIVTCGESLGIVFCTLLHQRATAGDADALALTAISTLLSLASSMAGVFSLRLPAVLAAVNWLSPLRYMVRNLAPFAMEGRTFTCAVEQMVQGVCPVQTGEQVLRLYGLEGPKGANLAAVVVCAVVYRVVAWGVVWGSMRR